MPLPPGLALNPETGVISGVPTTPGTYSFTLRVRDSQGLLRDIPSSITVAAYTAPSLSGTLTQFANRTVAYSSGLTVSNGAAPFVWSIAAGTLPTGLTIDSATGVISGTPTDTNYTDRTITVRVVDANGSAAQSVQTIRYANVLSLTGSLAAGVQGSAYNDGFDRSGGHSPFTYAITSGTLPAGLTFNTSTGVITGTPTSTSSTSITIRVTDASGATASRSGTLTINSAYTPINITGAVANNTQDVEVLSSFSITPDYSGVNVAGGSGSITYSWARISGSTAISAGSPSSLGTSFVGTCSPGASVSATFRLTATDGTSSDTLDVVITVNNVYVTMALVASGFPLATRTVPYGTSLSRTGGKSPFTFAVISGTLPTGITLNASTGALSGTPTDTTYTDRAITFRVTDALGATASDSETIVYRNFPTLAYALGAAMRTRAYSKSPTRGAGEHATANVTILSGALPTGISLTAGTGDIAGTPTDTSYGDRTFSFRLTDAAGNDVEQSGVVLKYANNLTIAGTVNGFGMVTRSYSSSALSASGGHGGNVWSIASGSLPNGLSINSSTGAITGTATADGTFNFTVRVTDVEGFTADSAQSIVVAQNLALAGTYPAGSSGVAYSSTAVTVSGGHGGNVWSVASGSLPTGLSLNTSTGALTGTPSSAGSFSFTVRVTDAQGFTADSAQSVTIAAGLSSSANASNFSGSVVNSPPSSSPPTASVSTTTPNSGVCVITASGGTAPYTYSWARVSGDTSIVASSPSSASTAFQGSCDVDAPPAGAVMRCTVTDSAMNTTTVDVSVSLSYLSGL